MYVNAVCKTRVIAQNARPSVDRSASRAGKTRTEHTTLEHSATYRAGDGDTSFPVKPLVTQKPSVLGRHFKPT